MPASRRLSRWLTARRRPARTLVLGIGIQLPAAALGLVLDRYFKLTFVVLVVAVAVLLASPLLTRLQRSRLGIPSAQPSAIADLAGLRRLGYHVLAGPLIALLAATLLLCCVLGVGWALAAPSGAGSAFFAPATTRVTSVALGLLFAPIAVALTPSLARWDARVGQVLLGPTREQSLEQQLNDVVASRAAVLEAATAERRRLERDLHDGAQQRLVALSVQVGLLVREAGAQSPELRTRLEDVRREITGTVADLRGLARGLGPPVLVERGLDAALSGLAARSPIPVTLDIRSRNVTGEAAAIAYYVIAEALANVAKHANAHSASVHVVDNGSELRVAVTDDGRGGAVLTARGGLTGLAARVHAAGGELRVASPLGGPTELRVELPCVS